MIKRSIETSGFNSKEFEGAKGRKGGVFEMKELKEKDEGKKKRKEEEGKQNEEEEEENERKEEGRGKRIK